jgi:hypothetical protein
MNTQIEVIATENGIVLSRRLSSIDDKYLETSTAPASTTTP